MKKKITQILMLALLVASVGMFNSCKDYDEDNYNDLTLQLRENSNLTDIINGQVTALRTTVDSLCGVVANINSCSCSDTHVNNLIAQYVATHPSMAASDVTLIIQNYLDTCTTVITPAEVQNMINTALTNYVTATTLRDTVNVINQRIADAESRLQQALNDSVAGLKDSLLRISSDLNQTAITANTAKNLADSAYKLAKWDSVQIVALGDSLKNVAIIASNAAQQAEINKQNIEVLTTAYEKLRLKDSTMQKSIDSIKTALNDYATKAELQTVLDSANTLYTKAINYINAAVDTLIGRGEFQDSLAPIKAAYAAADAALQTQITDLKNDLATLTTQVNKNTQDIKNLKETVENVLNKMITSIVVQGAVNPVFGQFALPVGVRSNMLVAYYGQFEHNVYFPTVSTSDMVYPDYALTDKDAEMIGSEVMEQVFKNDANGYVISEKENNAGKVYLTVNPNTADFTGAQFVMENTQGTACPIELGTLVPSTDKLTFGWTKATVNGNSTNGFYEAPATLKSENIDAAKFNIEPGLKATVKENLKAVKNQDYSGINISQLAQKVYAQFDGILDANWVKGTWTDSLGTHSVFSEALLAATAVKPLSYSFLNDRKVGDAIVNRLPNITPISNANFKFDEINFDLSNIVVNVPSINFDIVVNFADITLDELGNLIVTVDVPDSLKYDPITNTATVLTTKKQNVNIENYSEWINKLVELLNDKVEVWGNQIEDGIENQLKAKFEVALNQLTTNINQMIQDISGQMNTSINSELNNIAGTINKNLNNYISKMNKFIGYLNKAVTKVQGLLNNANYYLQPAVAYENVTGTLTMMSTSKTFPTVFNGTGAKALYLTSYSGEIVTPAYKKFVAITDVIKDGKSAKNNDADCLAEFNKVKAANKIQYQGYDNMYAVLDGDQAAVALIVSSTGYTYEIVYSALDYSGKIATRKYYVTVK